MHDIATIAEQRRSRLADEAATERLARSLRADMRQPARQRGQVRWGAFAGRFRLRRPAHDTPAQI